MNKLKRAAAFMLAAVSLLSFCACGEKKESGDVPTITWCLPANDLRDKAAVTEEINKITVPEIGARVEIQEYDFGTYGEKMKMKMASGDDSYDILFVGYLSSYTDAVKNGVLEPLDELIEKHAPELKKSIPDYVWQDAVYSDKKIYAIPNTQIMATQLAFGIQKTLAEKYGWTKTEIESPAELEEFLAKVKVGEPTTYPYRPNYGLTMWLHDYTTLAGTTGFKESGDSDEVVIMRNTPEYQDGVNTLRDWYNKGYIRSDVASVTDDNTDFSQNRYAVYNTTWKPGQESLFPNYMYVKIGKPIIKNGASLAAMDGINHKSKNKEKAIKLISLVNSNKQLYNLMSLGIEGTHYTVKEDGRIETVEDSGYAISGWIIGNQFNSLVDVNQDKDVWEQTEKLNEDAVDSKLRGFIFDDKNVKSEIMSISGVSGEYGAVGNGSRDRREYWDAMDERLKSCGEEMVLQEVSKQVREFISDK